MEWLSARTAEKNQEVHERDRDVRVTTHGRWRRHMKDPQSFYAFFASLSLFLFPALASFSRRSPEENETPSQTGLLHLLASHIATNHAGNHVPSSSRTSSSSSSYTTFNRRSLTTLSHTTLRLVDPKKPSFHCFGSARTSSSCQTSPCLMQLVRASRVWPAGSSTRRARRKYRG